MTRAASRRDTARAKTARGRPAASASRPAPTRDAIAAAALELFAERGFASVSNKDLGRAAGVNPALIYYHFKSKQDLFTFVVRKALMDAEAVYATRRSVKGGGDVLEAWLSGNVALSEELSRFLKIVFDYANAGTRRGETDRAIDAFYARELEVLGSALRREPLPARRARDLAELVSVFLDGVMVARVVRPGLRAERLVRVLRDLLAAAGQRAASRSPAKG